MDFPFFSFSSLKRKEEKEKSGEKEKNKKRFPRSRRTQKKFLIRIKCFSKFLSLRLELGHSDSEHGHKIPLALCSEKNENVPILHSAHHTVFHENSHRSNV